MELKPETNIPSLSPNKMSFFTHHHKKILNKKEDDAIVLTK